MGRGLRKRLPNIAVPLAPRDGDVSLEPQPLIDQCHNRGLYRLLDYQLGPFLPFQTEEAGWVDQILREHELRRRDQAWRIPRSFQG